MENGSPGESPVGLLSQDSQSNLPSQEAAPAPPADLHTFVENDRLVEERSAPQRTRELALALRAHVARSHADDAPELHTLDARVITDAFLRDEYDRDQNVYLGTFFKQQLTRATPDVVFQPLTTAEVSAVVQWAGETKVPVTLRGAGTTAMGGAVPSQGGVVLDLSRLDDIEINREAGSVVLGAGARMRPVHAQLAAAGLALPVYTSNLGGTFAGWFATGNIGINAFGNGRALDWVDWIEVVLPSGEPIRVHSNHAVEVPMDDGTWQRFSLEEAEDWFAEMKIPAFELSDWAHTEGQLGVVTRLSVRTQPRRPLAGLLLGFTDEKSSRECLEWMHEWTPSAFPHPANLKWLSKSHLDHAVRAWRDDDARAWRDRPSRLSDGSDMPWSELISPEACQPRLEDIAERGERIGDALAPFRAFVFIDFFSLEAGQAFCQVLDRAPGSPRICLDESLRFSAERFRPQSVKRYGPGLMAAEVLMPRERVGAFLKEAERRARGAGVELDAEVYHLADDTALVLAAYLADHRRGTFRLQLPLAPSMTDLAIRRYGGKPYVLGRWQGQFFKQAFTPQRAKRLRQLKRALDPDWILGRGTFFEMHLYGIAGGFLQRFFRISIRMAGALFGSTLARPGFWFVRGFLSITPGAAGSHGEVASKALPQPDGTFTGKAAAARAIHCVNCGECNSVCPIYQHSSVRLPQMLTHLGEGVAGGREPGAVGSTLLDLCMRCGNCEEVCQAGIPHLSLYDLMQQASDEVRPRDTDRHQRILENVRSAPRYRDEFLGIRPGGYQKRTPASLPGMVRFIVRRADKSDGAAATCIHCAACVSVCPTHANREYEGEGPRTITTQQDRCIGCGTCVEVCPANHLNGGQTLRVFEAPTESWLTTTKSLLDQLSNPDSHGKREENS